MPSKFVLLRVLLQVVFFELLFHLYFEERLVGPRLSFL